MLVNRALRISAGAAILIAIGLLLRIPGSSAGGVAAGPESPGQAAVTLECPAGDREIIGEALYGDTPQQFAPAPREALREFLRRHFRALLKLHFVRVARGTAKLQLLAQRDGHRIASVLLSREPGGVRAEGASACESVLRGR
jgi:hypothetical protein